MCSIRWADTNPGMVVSIDSDICFFFPLYVVHDCIHHTQFLRMPPVQCHQGNNLFTLQCLMQCILKRETRGLGMDSLYLL